MRHLVTAALLVLSGTTLSGAQIEAPGLTPGRQSCISIDPSCTRRPIDELRRAGPAGLREILAKYDENPAAVSAAEIDAVAGQHDALWSRLYWYTDLDAAKAAAKAEHKPILYLRLLGKLTDEYSCANSRFFRTILYANARVSKLLRDRFVLVWASERPVPVITVDYGDGRVLKRTITGNSVHYVLDADGRFVDALPGLYDPVKFAEIITAASDVAVSGSAESRRMYWERSSAALASEWQRETKGSTPVPSAVTVNTDNPLAADAMPRAMSKSGVERPLVRAAFPTVAQASAASAADADAATWARVAARHLADARLDANSLALIRSQNPSLFANSIVFNRTIDEFQRSIAEDTAQNNHRFRPQILAWLLDWASADPGVPLDLETLNQRVYADLFLTPRSDAWLGLVPEFTYSGLTSEACRTH